MWDETPKEIPDPEVKLPTHEGSAESRFVIRERVSCSLFQQLFINHNLLHCNDCLWAALPKDFKTSNKFGDKIPKQEKNKLNLNESHYETYNLLSFPHLLATETQKTSEITKLMRSSLLHLEINKYTNWNN